MNITDRPWKGTTMIPFRNITYTIAYFLMGVTAPSVAMEITPAENVYRITRSKDLISDIALGQRSEKILPEITKEEKETLREPERYEAIRKVFLDIREHYKTGIPSFDCSKAETKIEKQICSDKELGGLDYEMSSLFKYYKFYYSVVNGVSFDGIQSFQEQWLKDRNNLNCSPKLEDEKKCLEQLYKINIQVYKDAILRSFLRYASWNFDRLQTFPEQFKNKQTDYYSVDLIVNEGGLMTNPFVFSYPNCPIYITTYEKPNVDYYIKHGINICKRVDRETCPFHGPVYPGVMSFIVNTDILLNYCLNNDEGLKDVAESVNETVFTDRASNRFAKSVLMDVAWSLYTNLKDKYEIIQKLLDIGADKSWKNDMGKTAYDHFIASIQRREKEAPLSTEEQDFANKIKQLLKP